MKNSVDREVKSHLREIRRIMKDHSKAHFQHKAATQQLISKLDGAKESVAAVYLKAELANIESLALRSKAVDLRKRIERLELSK